MLMSSDVLTIEYCVIRYNPQYVHIADSLESEQKLEESIVVRFEKKKISIPLVVVTIIIAFYLCANVATSTITGTSVFWNLGTIDYSHSWLSYLHTEGSLVKNEFGQIVYLRGCNKMCMQFYIDPDPGAYNVKESDFENIKNLLGANVVRIDLALSLLFPTFDVNAPEMVYLDHMDDIVDWCGKREMYVLFDCHGYYPQMGAPEDFWNLENSGIRNPYRNMIRDFWVFIANRYEGNPTVFGFDLYEEPWNAVPTMDRPTASEWKTQVEEWIDAITIVNPKLIFVIENAGHQEWGSNDWRWIRTSPIDRTNIVYSPHFFPQREPDGTWKDYTWIDLSGNSFSKDYSTHNYAAAKENMETFTNNLWQGDLHYPILVGEFGCINDESGLRFLRDFLEVCDTRGWSWTYWAWVGRPQPSFALVLEDWVTLNPQGTTVQQQLQIS
jgi:endoglucanase